MFQLWKESCDLVNGRRQEKHEHGVRNKQKPLIAMLYHQSCHIVPKGIISVSIQCHVVYNMKQNDFWAWDIEASIVRKSHVKLVLIFSLL